MGKYFVIIKSDLRDANSILGLNTEYIIDAQILYDKKNGRDLYKNVTIRFLGKPSEIFFLKLRPGLKCLLLLKNENDDEFICDGADWYIKDQRYFSFKDDKEISPEIILSKY